MATHLLVSPTYRSTPPPLSVAHVFFYSKYRTCAKILVSRSLMSISVYPGGKLTSVHEAGTSTEGSRKYQFRLVSSEKRDAQVFMMTGDMAGGMKYDIELRGAVLRSTFSKNAKTRFRTNLGHRANQTRSFCPRRYSSGSHVSTRFVLLRYRETTRLSGL